MGFDWFYSDGMGMLLNFLVSMWGYLGWLVLLTWDLGPASILLWVFWWACVYLLISSPPEIGSVMEG